MSKLKIACVGDVMCGDSFYALGRGVASSLKKHGKRFLRPEIVNYLSRHDIVLCNVESILSNQGRKKHILRSIHMRGAPDAAEYLVGWGITVANVANNHILEHGYDAAVDTVNLLQSIGIKTIGAGWNGTFRRGNQVEEVTCFGHTIALIGVCFREEKYAFDGGAELDETIKVVKSLVKRDKIVMVSVHWGDELMNRPNTWQREIARELIASGSSVIVGHHPHVVQGIERINGGLVAYSLGNFIFDSFLKDTKWSMVLSITISGRKIVEWKCVPIEKDKEHRPLFAEGRRKSELNQEINRRCDLLKTNMATQLYQEEYDLDVKALDVQARRSLRRELLRGFLSISPVYWPQVLFRPIQRRLGVW